MAVNQVIYNNKTLINLTEDTVTADTLAEGVTAHDASGEQIVGTLTSPIKYVESTDTSNLLNLRDFESGTYVLYGKFHPFSGSTASITFTNALLVNIITKTAGTHVQVFYPVNNCVQFLSITDDSYERTNVYLNDLVEYIGTLSNLTTTDKTSLVAAINEVKALTESVSTDISWLDGYDIPKLYLTGDTTGMTKENPVTLGWEYGENSGSCTLKWQGNSSLAYEKKNYTIKLDTAIDIGYGEQKKYVLKANYIDFSHARNIVSARIWGMMVASRSNVNETLAASPNYGAVNGFPVAIVLNGKFHGLYTFNIPKDAWMMNMGSGTQECILCADHSTATQFKGEATLVGETDFEIEYITDESNTEWAKTSVNRLINACINSNGSDLDTTIAKYLDWESAIDYYILVALLDGHDMTDKNYLLSTYDGTKWFFGAYDMDSTYGLKWDGSYFSKASYGDHTSFASYANTHRVMELIKRFKTNALKARYAELRADVLSESTIAREFERFACSIPSRLLDEDRNVWTTIPCTSVNNTFQILCWLDRRLEYVDKWMEELPAQETPAGPSYTNQVPISTDDSGAVYNGVGYKDGYRLGSLSSGNGTEKAAEGSVLTGYIPIPDNTAVIRIKGVQLVDQQTLHCYVSTYNAEKQLQGYTTYDRWQSGATNHYELDYDEASGVYTITFGSSAIASEWTKFIRLNAYGKGADMIVTINEEIAG